MEIEGEDRVNITDVVFRENMKQREGSEVICNQTCQLWESLKSAREKTKTKDKENSQEQHSSERWRRRNH